MNEVLSKVVRNVLAVQHLSVVHGSSLATRVCTRLWKPLAIPSVSVVMAIQAANFATGSRHSIIQRVIQATTILRVTNHLALALCNGFITTQRLPQRQVQR